MKREIRLEYLCTNYGKERFLNWCCSLSIFRFCKSHPYPDDLNPDRFIALTSFKDEEDFKNLLYLMKIHVKGEVKGDFTYLANIKNTSSTQALVNEVQCYISINKVLKTIILEVSGTEEDQFLLDDSTFQRAKKIDDYLSTLNIDFICSPHNDDYCITPEFYPSVWE
ncbi:MAG: hypothetical protein H7641_09035 [Candidatus Heimdallarchaeota archaeon]|nr:hypothetical protein [Candidatus Heimdallarchaeota archaeon]MCK4877710.1 hypothetical protein [Candidatus Heimdallarchaeota archaeon]